MNKFEKALDRIKKRVEPSDDWTEEDIEHYKTIFEALEKQIPYKPKEYEDRYYGCKCDNVLLPKWKEYQIELMPKSEGLPYCLSCGQALDWSDTE